MTALYVLTTTTPNIWTDTKAAGDAISLSYRWWSSIAELTGTSGTSIR